MGKEILVLKCYQKLGMKMILIFLYGLYIQEFKQQQKKGINHQVLRVLKHTTLLLSLLDINNGLINGIFAAQLTEIIVIVVIPMVCGC